MARTRLRRVRRINAVVALAAAALACSAPQAPEVSRALVRTTLGAAQGRVLLGAPCLNPTLETCFDARDDDCDGLVDEGCGLPDGALQLVVAWDEPAVDVDLAVVDPGGEQVRVGKVTALGLSQDRNCPKAPNECGGQNVEVVYLRGARVPLGRYSIAIRLVDPKQVSETIEVRLGGRVGREPITGRWSLTAQGPEVRLEIRRGP